MTAQFALRLSVAPVAPLTIGGNGGQAKQRHCWVARSLVVVLSVVENVSRRSWWPFAPGVWNTA